MHTFYITGAVIQKYTFVIMNECDCFYSVQIVTHMLAGIVPAEWQRNEEEQDSGAKWKVCVAIAT